MIELGGSLGVNSLHIVIGRKAWLFSDTPAGARASATHYSLIETAKANGLDLRNISNRLLLLYLMLSLSVRASTPVNKRLRLLHTNISTTI